MDAAAAAGFVPRIPFETHSPASVCELVAAGLGVALLAGSSARAAGQAIDVHPLRPELAHPPIGLVQLRGRPPGPAARAWAEHLVRACGPGPGSDTNDSQPGRAELVERSQSSEN